MIYRSNRIHLRTGIRLDWRTLLFVIVVGLDARLAFLPILWRVVRRQRWDTGGISSLCMDEVANMASLSHRSLHG